MFTFLNLPQTWFDWIIFVIPAVRIRYNWKKKKNWSTVKHLTSHRYDDNEHRIHRQDEKRKKIQDSSLNICADDFKESSATWRNSSTSRGYITSSKMSTQLKCTLKHPLSDSKRQSHRFAAGIVCMCVCVWWQRYWFLLMCCGLQSEYNCSAHCHLISSSCLPDTSASL